MDAWNNLGIIAQECGNLAFSESCLRKVLVARPVSPHAHNNLANTLRRLGQSQQALHHYQQALVHDPQFVQACINQSSLLRELGHLARAAELAEQAIALDPRCAEAYLNLADLARVRQRPEEASRWLDALRAFAPDRVNAQGTTSGTALSAKVIAACHQQVLALSAEGRHAEVEALLTQTLANGNGPPTLWHLLARALRAQLKMEPALRIMTM
ncbi:MULTISPECIES: tetratricopeptide repeat protein [Symbiopectobacterium]|uniref:tetratricopeptide repeat protein n=1 Tax=Symbiopectobacterium TaxID=801 RepID=UPI001A22173B|nr:MULTISPECIES: tetratricopeptide repeat protein [Symbiopectobacterium]MBG6248614.1 tetratricopeptide repeat protein [Candidatus Symbiopectobacterium sp. PLON1]MBT9428778.1 tetratricopeptide repeat protein [Candidatus Symbiopectobacterium endolongispinus]